MSSIMILCSPFEHLTVGMIYVRKQSLFNKNLCLFDKHEASSDDTL